MGIIICGFGMSMVLMGIAFIIWGAESKGYPVEFGPAIFLGEIFLPRTYIWIAAVGLVIMIGLSFFLYKTKLGLAARAVAFNRQTAYLMGVNVPLMISLIFGIGCAVSGAAGVLIAPILFAQIQMGYVMMLKAFAAAVVGGFGSLPGAIIGGLMVGLFETLCAGYLWDEYRDIYAFFLMLVVLMIRPSGMLGINVKVKA
jgi:branched-chain amino acid transport system permease protein